ncbi:putative calcium-binding protein CML18 [Iris pallida]|nr:putative calcium-binding protein CML18 [Iris pallida]
MEKTKSMEEVEEVFKRFDADADGKITPAELGKVVRALGSEVSEREVEVMIEEMDSNRDGVVDLQEFSEFHRGGRGEEELKDAFDMYDADRNGLISAGELHTVMHRLGDTCTVEDCETMIGSVDSDGDGGVNMDEFNKMMGGRAGADAAAPTDAAA